MTAVLVDWLGRGGIAHCTEALAITLEEKGRDAVVVTRPGRELRSTAEWEPQSRVPLGRLGRHVDVVRAAVRAVRAVQPSVVVLANFVVPALEHRVVAAAHACGARVIVVVHDGKLHSRLAGTHLGLGRLLRSADQIVVHSRFVQGQLADRVGGRTPIEVVPLPVQVGLLRHEQVVPDLDITGRVAVHFGVLRRAYKGSNVVIDLAARGVDGWQFVVAGVGAQRAPGVTTLEGFLDPGVLTGLVERSDAALLPYTYATQSGAIVLAQALGAVPIASAVGGLVEQVDDGRTGVLVEAGAGSDAWAAAMRRLEDEGERQHIASSAKQQAWRHHEEFVSWATTLP
ncbi:MAG: hypothetical protein QOD92_3550 [Acidimicrobiaceae bacterium]